MYGPADAHTSTDALTSSVIAAGGVPVLLPVVPAQHAAVQLRGLAGLVLAGGQDVDPATYGGSPAADGAWVHRGRDDHERSLLAAARAAVSSASSCSSRPRCTQAPSAAGDRP